MPQPRKSPRTLRWRGAWHLFWFDPAAGKQRRLACEALGAHTARQRTALVHEYEDRELAVGAEAVRRGGTLAYDTPLREALGRFREYLGEQAAIREANPEARRGLAPASVRELTDTLDRFTDWLTAKPARKALTTGTLDARTLEAFIARLATEPTRNGNRRVQRAPATVNKHARSLKRCLRWLDDLRPPLFPDLPPLMRPLRPRATNPPEPEAIRPDLLCAFVAAAREREDPDHTFSVTRRKPGKTEPERFEQRPPSAAAVPVSRLALLLALTGARLGEVLALKWADVDLARGRLTIRAQKTGRRRVLPLSGAPESDVAPRLLSLLRVWKIEAGNRAHVLPHDGLPEPRFPKSAWEAAYRAASIERIAPQGLRRSWVSYAASLGVPAAVAGLWAGHSAAVAERHYRGAALDRIADATDFEQAMGLSDTLDRWLAADTNTARPTRRIGGGASA